MPEFPELLFPKCSSGGWLSTGCSKYLIPDVRHFATVLHERQMVNLIWRFMAIVGLVFDALSLWCMAYVLRPRLGRRGRTTSPVAMRR